MDKILLIIKREYFSRVKKKSFLMVTFLVPVLFIVMIGSIGYIASHQNSLADKKKVEVVDESGWFVNKLANTPTIEYSFSKENEVTAKAKFVKDGYDYLLYIPSSLTKVQLISENKPAASVTQSVENALTDIAQSKRLAAANIDSATLAAAQKSIEVEGQQITESGIKDAHIYASYGVGLLCAFLIYLSLFLYGTQVMRGVIEEKVSRIIEVIISSVKPFQLMLGKIIGVGMVGLTQFILWIVLTLALSTVAGTLVSKGVKARTESATQIQKNMGVDVAKTPAAAQPDNMMGSVMAELDSIPIAYTVGCFLFYFLFGYLLYSALFAAVGSAVDSETETQQFMLPITLPLIFTFAMSQSVIVNNPDSSLSVWLSMIPFTSPIAMMIRIPFGGVPAWQLALSMALMVLGFLFTTWVAARIYRVGILMYGKKASYKELAKWFFYKE
ncbi:MAG: ABC-type Na+ efflux pump permease component-like protein [Flavipsychrobacter sp.]|nr:ABC-type Na+ efflux pump permease component-like protein [Flavipsychrobacter sp.]